MEPPAGVPEVAIAGRSNVGKSSLINCLTGRRGLARTSRTPGRTRQLNFFLLNERFALVDLPGYGFAAGPEVERQAWGPLVEHYLEERPTLRGVVLVIDVRRGIETEEQELLGYLAAHRLPSAVVATKLDKLGRGVARTTVGGLTRRLGGIPVVGFSARTGEGRDQLWRLVSTWLAVPRQAAKACRVLPRRP